MFARRKPRRSARRRGTTLVEAMVSVAILSTGLTSAALLVTHCSKLQQSTAGFVESHNVCQDVLEQFRDGALTDRFNEYVAAPDFTAGDTQVQVRFPEDVLSEALGGAIPATARFRDMDSDGQVDLDPASTDPGSLLPVRITVSRGAATFTVDCLMTER